MTVVEKIYMHSGTEGRESPHVSCGESKSRINIVIGAQGPSVPLGLCVLGFHEALPLMLSLFAKLCPQVPAHWSHVIWGLAFPVSCSSLRLLLLMASGLFKLENAPCETSVSCSDSVVSLCPRDSTRRLSTAPCHPGSPHPRGSWTTILSRILAVALERDFLVIQIRL